MPKMYSFYLWLYSILNGCTAFQKYTYEDHRICTALEKTVHFSTNTIVNEIRSQGHCTKDVQLFSLVVQCFKWLSSFSKIYIYEDHRIYTALEKLYILVHTPLSMKLKAKNNVQKMYSFFLSLYSFLMFVQLSKIIHMKTTEFVQLWKKMYILVQTPLSMKLGAKDTVPKMYSFFLWLYSVLNGCLLFKYIYIYMRTTEFIQLWKNCTFWYTHHCQ